MTRLPFFPFFNSFATFSRQCVLLIHDRILKASKGRVSEPRWGGDCETMRLLGLEGEYLSFLLDVEVELGLLHHVLGCEACLEAIKGRISGDGECDLGTIGELFDDLEASSVVELDEVVERIICERIELLGRLREDADLELESLRENLKPLIRQGRG